MTFLSVKEYDKVTVGDTSIAGCHVSESEARALCSLKKTYGYDIFRYVDGKTIAPRQYVGSVQVGALTVEVLPKIDGIDGTKIRHNLIKMLATVKDLKISDGDVARVGTQNNGLLEILIKLFCEKLFKQVHKGVTREYDYRSENLSVLRGKIGIVEQIRLNAANPERLFCHFEEFHADILLNQIIKTTLRFLAKISNNQLNQRSINELLMVYESVTDIAKSAIRWEALKFNRLNIRYEPICNLAKLFLKATPQDVTSGNTHGFSLFFNMNELFEEYIGRVTRRQFQQEDFRVCFQGPIRYLAKDKESQRNVFAMKPDIIGFKENQSMWIIDTKWKTLSIRDAKDGIAQSDVYQVYAYAMRYKCPNVILLYPHHSQLGERPGLRSSYLLNDRPNHSNEQQPAQIRIATVDLSDLSQVRQQLNELLQHHA